MNWWVGNWMMQPGDQGSVESNREIDSSTALEVGMVFVTQLYRLQNSDLDNYMTANLC